MKQFDLMGRIQVLAIVAGLLFVAVPLAGVDADDDPRVVQIVIEQTYQFRKPSQISYEEIEDFDLPALALAEDMLFAAGMDVAYGDEPGDYDAVLTVSIRGRALGSTYLEPVKAFLYTGVQLDGDVRLVPRDGAPARSNFLSEIQRQFQLTINLGYDDPRNAPFVTALEQAGGLVNSLAHVMYQIWGIEVLVPALYEHEPVIRASVAKYLGDVGDPVVTPDLIEVLAFDDDDRARWEAAWSLGRIGDEQAIPSLIEALRDASEDVRWFSSWSLRTMTGESFGPDYETWSEWWAEQELSVEG